MNVEYPEWMGHYQKPQVLAGGAALILVLALALAWTAWRWNMALDRMEMMEAQAAVGFLRPPSSTQTLRIDPRAGRLTGIYAGEMAQRIDLAIAVNSDRFDRFRIALSRDDGLAILHTERLAPDSNGDLHLGFNTSMLPDGIYRLRIEGYTRRGELEKYAESRLSVSGR
ncbi:MAG: hypothetical protein HW417_1517 [Steroidobacteraceae bacterium]|jgi:hypothetical protein|nr:hypothetical protein [Steroidobacteraceae bacterium]